MYFIQLMIKDNYNLKRNKPDKPNQIEYYNVTITRRKAKQNFQIPETA